jgi:bud site selection protein 31
MPKVRTSKTKPPPEGWEELEPILEEVQRRMREAENESHEGKRRNESIWPVIRLDHQRSRIIFEKHFKRKEISKDLYDWLVKEGWANAALIAKWKKSGYDSLCCLQCILPTNFSHGGVCICRVPRKDLSNSKLVECQHCGCRGCASGDIS